MSVKLLTEHHLEFIGLKGGCAGSSESTLVKMTHCWKSHVTAHIRAPALEVSNLDQVRHKPTCFVTRNSYIFKNKYFVSEAIITSKGTI